MNISARRDDKTFIEERKFWMQKYQWPNLNARLLNINQLLHRHTYCRKHQNGLITAQFLYKFIILALKIFKLATLHRGAPSLTKWFNIPLKRRKKLRMSADCLDEFCALIRTPNCEFWSKKKQEILLKKYNGLRWQEFWKIIPLPLTKLFMWEYVNVEVLTETDIWTFKP